MLQVEVGVYETDGLVVNLLAGEKEGKGSDAPDLHVAGDVGYDIVTFETARAEGCIVDTVLEDSVS